MFVNSKVLVRKNSESPTKTEASLRPNKTYDKQLDSVKRVHKQQKM